MKASILAVGTELTTGQITNKNASWISAQLKPFGVEVNLHLTIPDDRPIIAETLVYAENHSDVLFVTGGLGPTSDDFTRDLIADWCGEKLEFHEPSWKHIQERLTSRGYQVREIQKQQCYYPKNARVLTNSQGTAHGFYVESKKPSGVKHVFVLPGPPREIAAIWKDHITPWLKENTQHIDKILTRAWDTLGVGESDVALKVEDILKEAPQGVKIDIGYRVHLPYVEVKLSFKESDSTKLTDIMKKMDAGLDSITVSRDFADVADMVSKKISTLDFTFYDFITQGFLHNRLSTYLKNQKSWSWKQGTDAPSVELFQNEENFLALLPFDDEKIFVIFDIDGKRRQLTLESPIKSPLMKERSQQYYAEMALVHLSRLGSASRH